MAYPSSASAGPQLGVDLSAILPYETTLKNGLRVRLDRIVLPRQLNAAPSAGANATRTGSSITAASTATIAGMRQIINFEIIDRGDSYPFEHALSPEQFEAYYFSHDTFCLRLVHPAQASPALVARDGNDDPSLVGCFYIKPNYPGRCAHVCNGGFLVRESFKATGAGYVMAERYLHLAKALGYRASMFNLVFVSNHGSNRLWEKLGFTRLARVPGVGRLKDWEAKDKAAAALVAGGASKGTAATAGSPKPSGEVYCDAFQWYYEFHDKAAIPYRPAAWEVGPTIGGKSAAAALPRRLVAKL